MVSDTWWLLGALVAWVAVVLLVSDSDSASAVLSAAQQAALDAVQLAASCGRLSAVLLVRCTPGVRLFWAAAPPKDSLGMEIQTARETSSSFAWWCKQPETWLAVWLSWRLFLNAFWATEHAVMTRVDRTQQVVEHVCRSAKRFGVRLGRGTSVLARLAVYIVVVYLFHPSLGSWLASSTHVPVVVTILYPLYSTLLLCFIRKRSHALTSQTQGQQPDGLAPTTGGTDENRSGNLPAASSVRRRRRPKDGSSTTTTTPPAAASVFPRTQPHNRSSRRPQEQRGPKSTTHKSRRRNHHRDEHRRQQEQRQEHHAYFWLQYWMVYGGLEVLQQVLQASWLVSLLRWIIPSFLTSIFQFWPTFRVYLLVWILFLDNRPQYFGSGSSLHNVVSKEGLPLKGTQTKKKTSASTTDTTATSPLRRALFSSPRKQRRPRPKRTAALELSTDDMSAFSLLDFLSTRIFGRLAKTRLYDPVLAKTAALISRETWQVTVVQRVSSLWTTLTWLIPISAPVSAVSSFVLYWVAPPQVPTAAGTGNRSNSASGRPLEQQQRHYAHARSLLEESWCLFLPGLTLLLPGFLTTYAVWYVQFIVPLAWSYQTVAAATIAAAPESKQSSTAPSSSDRTPTVRLMLQYWALHCFVATVLSQLSPLLRWIPLSTHAVLLVWSYLALIVPATMSSISETRVASASTGTSRASTAVSSIRQGQPPEESFYCFDVMQDELASFGVLPMTPTAARSRQAALALENQQQQPAEGLRFEQTRTVRALQWIISKLPSADQDVVYDDSGSSSNDADDEAMEDQDQDYGDRLSDIAMEDDPPADSDGVDSDFMDEDSGEKGANAAERDVQAQPTRRSTRARNR